jgi:geranylgeranyl pyrophosphate synthase
VTTTTTSTPSEVQNLLERGGTELRDRLLAVERELRVVVGGSSGTLAPHATAIVAAGGKRLRPLLVLLAANAAESSGAGTLADDASLIRAAVSIELVHSATLVHDDVLDAAPVRRGIPTVFATGGRALATAAGDHLFARAFAELVRNGSATQLQALSAASSALAVGELHQREDAYRVDVSVERYLLRCELKTGRLFEAAARLGVLAVAGDDDPALVDGLGAYAAQIGLAFQLLDDVLDVAGDMARTGKRPGADLLDGTITLPLILARERDPSLAEVDVRTLDQHGAADVCRRIAATGALDVARARALSLVATAKSGLPAAITPSARELLELVADAVVDRYR